MNELGSNERVRPQNLPVAAPADRTLAVAQPAAWIVIVRRPAGLALFHLNRLGRGGLAGLGLLAVAVSLLFAGMLPQYRESGSLEQRIAALKGQPAPGASAHQRVSDFVLTLPARGDLPQVAGRIYALAGEASVSLDKGRYELTPLKTGHLARYRMSFPVKGSYTNIRHFLDAALTALPSVSIEGLRLERKNAGDAEVEADIRLSVFVRNE